MKHRKFLSILLASAMIGTAPASAWAAEFTDVTISETAGDVTEEATEEAASQQQETADLESEDLQQSQEAEDLTETDDAETFAQESEDPFSDGAAAVALSDGDTTETGNLTLKGTGTEADPYQIASTEDIQAVADYVNNGKGTFANQYLKFTEDITLPTGWTPIGTKASKFQGNLDGDNHLLTIPEGEKALLGYVAESTLKNLNIYGKQIASNGVVCNYEVDYSSANPIKIDNVTLKSGTQTLQSGFIGGYASGQNQITITNSTVEKGVVIGYDRQQKNIGSFGGALNGYVQDCVSYADVYGTDFVGGICGNKSQTMGDYELTDCKFYGTVTASGNYAGGISGGGYGGSNGYGMETAPNTPCVTIQGCCASGTITGSNYVGGILGAEPGVVQCWDNGIGYIQDNRFEGTVTATDGSYVGGVIGYINGLDKYNIIENNKYICDGVNGIGFIRYIDTNCKNPTPVEGVTYYNTEKGVNTRKVPKGVTKAQHNRTDDPLGADAKNLASGKDIRVNITILGDQIHDSDSDHNYHTYYAGNLETWVEQSEYTVAEGSVVRDVISEALQDNNMIWDNPTGTYIAGITRNGTKLSEFTNGKYSGWMYTINGIVSNLGVSQQKVEDNDQVVLFYTDYYFEEGNHSWQTKWSYDKESHWHECSDDSSLGGACHISGNDRKQDYGTHTFDEGKVTKEATYTQTGIKTYTCNICGYEKNEEIPVVPHNHSWDKGTVTKAATCTAKGVKTYKCTVCGKTRTETIPAAGHSYNWKTTASATVFAPAKQVKVCDRCGSKTKETRNYGKKLTATIRLNVTSLSLKEKQSTGKVKVTGLAKGDSVKSWTSENSKIATVTSKGVIKGVKAGQTTVTVKLASGKTAKITVTVKKNVVKTTRITGVKSKVTLAKGRKLTLKPVVTPKNSTEKVTYVSSNSKVATVSANGVITAKKKGTAVITVRSGSKKVTCKVTVK